MRVTVLAAILLPLVTACASLVDTETGPSVDASASYASAYWFRGTPINVNGVYQGDVSASIPTTGGGAVTATTWVNLDSRDDTGDAISPDGNANNITEADFILDYSQSLGGIEATAGLTNFTFPSLVGPSTTELFVGIAFELLGLSHGLTFNWDIDELNDAYVAYDVSHGFELAEQWLLSLSAHLGYMGKGQSEFYFGTSESGISDLTVSAALEYSVDELTSCFLSLNSVTPLDSDLKDALDDAGYDDSGLWFALGLSWSF